MGLIKRLFHMGLRSQLPRLPHTLSSRDIDEPDEDANLLLQAGVARDWAGAKLIMSKRGLTARELFYELSQKRRPNWQRRLKHLLIRAMGRLPYDPHSAELKRLQKGIYYDGPHTRTDRIKPRGRVGKRYPRQH